LDSHTEIYIPSGNDKKNAIENGDLYIYIVDLPIENADFP
jgi:hypothetical protein